MSDKKNMLMKIEEYKLRIPQADTKTMPGGLRKEVREFVKNYIGNYSVEMRRIKSIKRKEFFAKYKLKLEKEIKTEVEKDLKEYKKKLKAFEEVYQIINKDDRIELTRTFSEYDFNSEAKVQDYWIEEQLKEKFNEQYGEGFSQFNEMLEGFEKTIEEAIIFGVITDVYKLIKEYAKFEPFLKKLSNLKIL